jgi:hypothetical protein
VTPADVSFVIVTRGNVNLNPVLSSLPKGVDVVVWDNSKLEGEDEKVYGRYCGINSARHSVIAVQDDDAIIEDWPGLIKQYEPGVVTCNMGDAHSAYYAPMGLALVGFGAVFDRSFVRPTFDRYSAHFPMDELFLRECDRVFTALNHLRVVKIPYLSLPHEETTERMWRESRHAADLAAIRARIAKIKNG